MHLALLNIGLGNIRSLQKAFEFCGANVTVTSDPSVIEKADALLIPGDGAFGRAMQGLEKLHLLQPIYQFAASGRPLLGVCIGFQLFFEGSNEFGEHNGLGLLNGTISNFDNKHLIVPHMGWSPTHLQPNQGLLRDMPNEAYFYYVHSFRLPGVHPYATGTCDYGGVFTAIVEHKNLYAVQFHPEKSTHWGLAILRNFLKVVQGA